MPMRRALRRLRHVMRRVAVVEDDLSCRVRAGDLLMHPIYAAQQRRLPAPGGSDDRRGPKRRELDRDSLHGLRRAVVGVEIQDRDPMSSVHEGWSATERDGGVARRRQGLAPGVGL